MRSTVLSFLLLVTSYCVVDAIVIDGKPARPVTTYSIIAHDPDTGQLGVAVQSNWF